MNRALVSILFLIGMLFDAQALDSTSAGLVVTFFGLLAAAILPALSLLAANTVAPGFSVAKVAALKAKLDILIDRLIVVLWMLLLGACAVILLQLGLPKFGDPQNWKWVAWLAGWLPSWMSWLPQELSLLLHEAPIRLAQSTVFTCFVLCLDRMRVVPSAFREVLGASYELAVNDSQKRIDLAAPSEDEIGAAFPTSESFGSKVDLEDEISKKE